VTAHRGQSILVVDDAPEIHDLVEVRLHADDLTILHALDAQEGLRLARSASPDVVLLDLDLPEKSGLDVCRELQSDPRLAAVPIIFLTGTVDVATKVKAFDAGAADYVTKPFDAVELRARVGAALRTKRYLDLLATSAQLDGLTGLWNRAYFDSRLDEDVSAAVRYGRGVALLIIDVDHFKAINDTCGHPFGDLVLRRVAEKVTASLRPGDVACRWGGDEFTVILREADRDGARAVAERIRAGVAEMRLAHGTRSVPVHVSIGLATVAQTPHELFAAADRGLYRAKLQGRNAIGEPSGDGPHVDPLREDEQPPPLRAGARIGDYEVLEQIGRGSMATVYRALDSRHLREVALKVIAPSALRVGGWRRFATEASALESLDHPNIVRVLDHGITIDGSHFLALELLAGRTVRERLFAGPFPRAEALRTCCELASALAVAHERGIVHRDLKPENLFLVDYSGALKVLDFGLAKVTAPLTTDDGRTLAGTEAGVVLGTVGYLSPEQARGRPIDHRSDLFSVGAILYELVTGRRAFDGDSPLDTLHAVVSGEPTPTGDAPLDAVLQRCLAKRVEDRTASARALETALRELV
jgi:diguanylate cyclase (GGDEF)-like protein